MATVSKWTPFGVALDITATGGTVTRTSATQFKVIINASWETYYSGAQTNYGMSATSGGTTSTISAFNGTKRSSGSSSFTGTYSISGNGSASKTITVTFKNFNTDNGDSASKNVSFTVTVPAWTSYAIKYNANGGSGAPGSQTKWKDQALTLSSTKPTRTGYSFLGWSTSSTATTATYSAGGKYTANAAAILYAVWKANTYTVTYNANGGTGAPGSQTKTYGKTLTLSSIKPDRTNYTFKGWGTSASATTVTYSSGGSYSANANITLYAVWELSYTKPKISNFTVTRCTSGGIANDEGTYCRVVFDWESSIDSIAIRIECVSGSGVVDTVEKGVIGSTSGKVGEIVGNGSLTTEATYTIRVSVGDSGGTSYASRSLPGLKFTFDVLSGGTGVAFGKPAEKSDYADFAFGTHHRKDAVFENNKVLRGTNPDGTVVEALNLQNANGNTVLGYGNYDREVGLTNIYGYDINFGVSNTSGSRLYYKPYYSKGDTINVDFRSAGYVTNSGTEVYLWIPLSMPIIGKVTMTAASVNGYILRQGAKYTHGSSASVRAHPSSYAVICTNNIDNKEMKGYGICIKATFSDTTNVTNNDTIGIHWSGTITFS